MKKSGAKYDHKVIETKWPNSATSDVASMGAQTGGARGKSSKAISYDHKVIETKWQKQWAKEGVYKTDSALKTKDSPSTSLRTSRQKTSYVLDMFPYPSGAGLHVGHPRGYIASDVFARLRRMQGYNVLHPMGFDAFGLPAEQYAIQTGKHPSLITNKSIETFKKQLSILGLSYDWSREVETTDPEFYKWTQWIFLQIYNSWFGSTSSPQVSKEKNWKARPIEELVKIFEKSGNAKVQAWTSCKDIFSAKDWKGFSQTKKEKVLMDYRLAYEGYSKVNWCEELGTVLANDEVIIDEKGNQVSERGGYPVVQKEMRQWFMRITAYGDRLIDGLTHIDWPENIKEIQKNWIGQSVGSEISFEIRHSTRNYADLTPNNAGENTRVVLLHGKNSRPDKHWFPWLSKELEKKGVDYKGVKLSNPDDPKLEEWLSDLDKVGPDENTILIGHSRGGLAILRWLEKLPKGIKVKKVILVAANSGNSNNEFVKTFVEESPNSKGFFTEGGLDFKKIRSHCDNFVVLHSKDDEWVPYEASLENSKNLSAKFLSFDNKGHFTAKSGVTKLPEVLQEIFQQGSVSVPHSSATSIKVFTTRADTLFGVTYVVLSPEHELVEDLKLLVDSKNRKELEDYILKSKAKTEEERISNKTKTGVELKGIKAINPANQEEIPVWVADYVLADYGTGAVMAVPAHDERDFEFAKKYSLPVKQVIAKDFHLRGVDSEKPGLEIVNRRTVDAIIRDKDNNFYLIKEDENHTHFVGGGVEDGEFEEDALKREITEEVGFTDFSIGKKIGPYISVWQYRHTKNKDVHSFGCCYEVVLNSLNEIDSEIEKGIHKLIKVPKEKVLQLVNWEHHKFLFERYLSDEKVFVFNGVLVNSKSFNQLSSEEAKTKITEFVGGKIVTKYKMRDAVFARQRYWGEPIPLQKVPVKGQKVLIIHGFEGSAKNDWMPWMKDELKKAGFEVRVPTMKTSMYPDLNAWMKELAPLVRDFTAEDIIIGHSLGSCAALHLLNKTQKNIKHLFLVASAIGEIGQRKWDEFKKEDKDADIDALRKFWEAPLDIESAGNLAENVTVILSQDDPDIPLHTHDNLPVKWDFQLWSGYEHFNDKKIPKLRDEILKAKSFVWKEVGENKLPLKLPNVKSYKPAGNGDSPLAGVKSWKDAGYETNTMPGWAGSSWYYLAYAMREIPKMNFPVSKYKNIFSYWSKKPVASRQSPVYGFVDMYVGGAEHSTGHLLYSRFWHKVLKDRGFVNTEEPFQALRNQGMILATDGRKMSKRWGNVVNPDDVVKTYGADTIRLYEMFIGPFEATLPWSTESIIGCRRFLERVWGIAINSLNSNVKQSDEEVEQALAKVIDKVTSDIEDFKFNTAVSAMMIFVNEISGKNISLKDMADFIKLLAPFAPHMTEELYQSLVVSRGSTVKEDSIHLSGWPKPRKIKESDSMKLAVMIDGKPRGMVSVPKDLNEEDIKKAILKEENFKRWFVDKKIAKVIIVPGKIVSFVLQAK